MNNNNGFIPLRVVSEVVNYFNVSRREAHFGGNNTNCHIVSGTLADNGVWFVKVEHVSGKTLVASVTPDNDIVVF